LKQVAIDVTTVFERGGRELLDFLEYCVLSVKKDVLFVYLVREYRQRPVASGALAIYDMFCAAAAPARISAAGMLPPKDMRLEQSVAPLRRGVFPQSDSAGSVVAEALEATPNLLPPRYLFDSLVQQLTASPDTVIATVQQTYDPSLTPHENLPGGQLTPGQRAFVEHVWSPIVRPHLVTAGFWRIATVA
jgi:hypothetical protein